MNRPICRLLTLSLPLTMASAFASAGPPEEAGQNPGRALTEAYQNRAQYQATAKVTIKQSGPWQVTRTGQVQVALDREGQRLAIDHPAARVVVKDGTLHMKSETLPGHHLETSVQEPISYEAVRQAVPFLANPPLIDLALLLADDPMAALSAGQSGQATPVTDDNGQVTGLTLNTAQGELTLHFKGSQPTLTRAKLAHDGQQTRSQRGPEQISTAYQFENKQTPRFAEDTFAFDTSNSQAADSLRSMVQNARQAQRGGQSQGNGGGGASGGNGMQGENAPQVELSTMDGKPFNLNEHEAEVVVFDFWATWCPPCRKALPKLQAVHDWAEAEDKSVSIYAVNVRESKDKARQYWEKEGFSMPVLMDPDGQAANQYKVQGIPKTVVIADGKVQAVHTGFNPSMEQTLKADIREAMK
jgi:thiol-disulfide isomerase/thioredoxin